jgi:hypothetical protein
LEAHPYSVNLKNEISHSNLLISIFKFTDFIQLSKAQQIEISNEKSEISKKKARSVRLTIPDVAAMPSSRGSYSPLNTVQTKDFI